jgi:PAS domain S-box-containing protein
MLTAVSQLFGLYQLRIMNGIMNAMYDDPFKVSASAQIIKSEVFKMHRDMKDIVLSQSDEELQKYINQVDVHEQHVYSNLASIRSQTKSDTEKNLVHETEKLFRDWKPIRSEVIRLIQSGERTKAIDITKNKGGNHVLKLEQSSQNLYLYAHRKAINFKNNSDAMYQKLSITVIVLGSLFLTVYAFLAYFTVRRISNYTAKNDHLTGVLSVIRAINQLIVRVKSKKTLIQESCNILVSNHVYGNALIVLYDENKGIDTIASADASANFTGFKTKIESGWIPPCIQNVATQKEGYLLIKDTKLSCPECPLSDRYQTKGALSIQLKYNDKVYGNISLSVNEAYIHDKEEISLLEEVAGDISYALHNFETQEHLMEQEKSLSYFKELYENIIDSVDNIIFVKDINFTYTVCNQAFENFVGKANHEIIGKTDYEIFNQEVADFFRYHDVKMFEEKKSKSNFEWVTYPDGRHVYLFTVKSPLLNSAGKILGLVGNSADVTEQRIAEEALTRKKKELETILQEAPNPIMLHNEAGEVVMVNHVWQSLSGYPFEEIDTVEKWADKACDTDKPLMREYMDKLYSLEHKIDMGEASVTTKEGNTLIWQFSSAPLGIIDGKRTVVTTAMDITELKRKDQLMMAQSRHAAMGEMIGMIAHQWRQPISGIAMNANNILLDIALETFDTASATVYAQDILDQTQHLSKTIDDFRNFFKPDKSVTSVNLKEIIEETFTIVKESLTNNGIQIKTTYLSETKVDAYSRELMQVFVNLINNAKDALLSRETKEPYIDICVDEDELYLNTTVCDNGGGISEAVLPKLFDPYFTTKDEKTGTGLGLYMSKMIIEDHLHGVIEAYNSNDGACFKVRLLKNSPKNEILI